MNFFEELLARRVWMEHAACRGMDPNLFHPFRGEDTRPAKAICAKCPVREECLESGMTQKQGIWGGLSERERRSERRHWLRGMSAAEIIANKKRAA